uniref:C-myc n=1 Tax=Panagrolaimus sp. ES5 TaxID=591445 RepID=A0AC34F1Q1_9BILA
MQDDFMIQKRVVDRRLSHSSSTISVEPDCYDPNIDISTMNELPATDLHSSSAPLLSIQAATKGSKGAPHSVRKASQRRKRRFPKPVYEVGNDYGLPCPPSPPSQPAKTRPFPSSSQQLRRSLSLQPTQSCRESTAEEKLKTMK